MQIYTMGFTKKSAETFFDNIRKNHIDILIDIRLNNQSQLAGFTKGKDLEFFLKEICQCKYEHEINFAPTQEILNDYKSKDITWAEYEILYNQLIVSRDVGKIFKEKYFNYSRVLLLCSEPTPEKCHRRLIGEYLRNEFGFDIVHI